MLEEARVLLSEGRDRHIHSLAVWEGQLINGHGSATVPVWDVSTGEHRAGVPLRCGVEAGGRIVR